MSNRGRLRRASLALVAIAIVAPPAAIARIVTFGSSLRAPANRSEAHGPDTAFWSRGPHSTRVPVSGRLVAIRLKGVALASGVAGAPPPLRQIHFQDLRPQPRGALRVMVTSPPYDVPVGGNPNRISTFRPHGMCVHAGDYIAFNDEGGFMPRYYPHGVRFRVFSSVARARTDRYTADNGTKNGDALYGRTRAGEELLMQLVVATGGRTCRR